MQTKYFFKCMNLLIPLILSYPNSILTTSLLCLPTFKSWDTYRNAQGKGGWAAGWGWGGYQYLPSYSSGEVTVPKFH